MITGRQIRAARSLLGWKSAELAEKAGLTRETISDIENGATNSREGTLERIARVFDENGVDFTDNDGLKLKPKNIETFEGQSRFDEFYEFIHEHLRTRGGDICIYGHNGRIFSKYRKDPELHRNRMKELKKQRPAFSVRTLQEEGDDYMPNAAFSEYRWQRKEYFPPTAYYVFGNCVALISFDGPSPPFVILVKSSLFAEAYRRSFDFAWQQAEVPPPVKPVKKKT